MNDWRPFVYGGLASVTAEFGTFPIDTTKTRLQVQGQQIDTRHSQLRYRGMIHAATRIFQEEGLTALYSGLRPAILRQATYGTIKFGIYHSLKAVVNKDSSQEKLLHNVFCAVIAGTVSSAIANPTDVLKVRMQADAANFSKKGMIVSFREIFQQEGISGLWRGVGPNANRAAVVVGVELPVYDVCKKHMLLSGKFKDNPITHFIASFIAGFAGAAACNPIDVVKTRMMNQRKLRMCETQAIYSGSIDCLIQTCRTEGVLALYKGFIPNWVRLGPWAVIFFVTFEQLKKIY